MDLYDLGESGHYSVQFEAQWYGKTPPGSDIGSRETLSIISDIQIPEQGLIVARIALGVIPRHIHLEEMAGCDIMWRRLPSRLAMEQFVGYGWASSVSTAGIAVGKNPRPENGSIMIDESGTRTLIDVAAGGMMAVLIDKDLQKQVSTRFTQPLCIPADLVQAGRETILRQ